MTRHHHQPPKDEEWEIRQYRLWLDNLVAV